MYGRAYKIFLSRGRSTPAMRAMSCYPCRCLCLGLRLQMTRMTPRRLITLQCSQIGLTLVRTFKRHAPEKNPIKSRTIDGLVSSRKGRDYGALRNSASIHSCPGFRNPRKIVSRRDRKSTRLNSSHSQISYAVFCLKKKKKKVTRNIIREQKITHQLSHP